MLTDAQSVVCVVAIQTCKTFGVITYRDFSSDEARKCMFSPVLVLAYRPLTAFQGSQYHCLSLS